METTIGNLLLNKILPPEMKRYDRRVDKKALMAIVAEIGKKHPDEYGRIVKQLKDLGDEYATQLGSSFSYDDFKPDYTVEKTYKKYSKEFAKIQKLDEGVIKDTQRRDLNLKIEGEINKKVGEDLHKGDNRFLLWGKTGAKGGNTNFRQILYASGNQVDVKKEMFPHMSRKSLSEGLAPSDFFITCLGARTGVVGSFNSVRDPGAYSKELYSSVNETVITKHDCNTTRGKIFNVKDKQALDRYLAKDQFGFPRNTLIDSTVQDQLAKKGATEIIARSPLFCEAIHGLCVMCFGPKEDGKLPHIGDSIGLRSAQSIVEPLTQLALNAKHTGGVVGRKNAFEQINQLFHAPENFSGGAVLTHNTGTVNKIEKTPDGGHNIYIDDEKYYATPLHQLHVTVGKAVNKGDALTDGVKNPKEVVDLLGIDAGREYLASAVQEVYKDNGKDGHSKVFETIVRGTMNHGVVEDVGDHHDLVLGSIVDWNRSRALVDATPVRLSPLSAIGYRLAEGLEGLKADTIITDKNVDKLKGHATILVYKKPAVIKAQMVSSERAALYKDFISAQNYRNIKHVLTEAVAHGDTADIHGYNPVTAYAYGAELGRGPDGQY